MKKTWLVVRGIVELLLGLYMAVAGASEFLIVITRKREIAYMLGGCLGSGILAILGCYVLADSFKVFKRVRSGGAVVARTR